MGLFDFIRPQPQEPVQPKHRSKRSIEDISKQIIAQRDNLRRNGFKHYVYIANKCACPQCKALDGKHFPVSKLKIGVNAPPMHEGCTCSIAAWIDEKKYNKWLKKF